MLSFKDFTRFFGSFLTDNDFQSFLSNTFSDLSDYNVSLSDYIVSGSAGIELGFTNNDAVYDDDTEVIFEKGNPVFSHFNLYPVSEMLVTDFPFNVAFKETRKDIITRIGQPTKTNQGYADFLNKDFLVDNYKVDDIIVTFDYDSAIGTVNFIQLRDNNLKHNLKL